MFQIDGIGRRYLPQFNEPKGVRLQLLTVRQVSEWLNVSPSWVRDHGIAKDYTGPLAKSDAQRVLDLLIAQDAGTYVPPDTAATVAMVAREYLALSEPNWGPRQVPVANSVVTKHIMNSPMGSRPIVAVSEMELQTWLNEHVNAGASQSLLKKLLLHIRSIFKHARKRKIMIENPTEDLRAKSKQRVCGRYLTSRPTILSGSSVQ
jgi:hypothetical protein